MKESTVYKETDLLYFLIFLVLEKKIKNPKAHLL